MLTHVVGKKQRRKHTRLRESVPVRVHLGRDQSFDVSTLDISCGGLCMAHEQPLRVGQKLVVEFLYETEGQLKQLSLNSRVVHQRRTGGLQLHGVQFLSNGGAFAAAMQQVMSRALPPELKDMHTVKRVRRNAYGPRGTAAAHKSFSQTLLERLGLR